MPFHIWRCNRWRDADANSTDWVKAALLVSLTLPELTKIGPPRNGEPAVTLHIYKLHPILMVKNHSRSWYPVPDYIDAPKFLQNSPTRLHQIATHPKNKSHLSHHQWCSIAAIHRHPYHGRKRRATVAATVAVARAPQRRSLRRSTGALEGGDHHGEGATSLAGRWRLWPWGCSEWMNWNNMNIGQNAMWMNFKYLLLLPIPTLQVLISA